MTINNCNCCIQIQDEARKKRWEGIFEGDWIPVAGPARRFGEFPGDISAPYYSLAVYKLTSSQKLLIAKRTSEHFNLDFDKFLNDLERPNVIIPILEDDTIMMFCPMHTRMMTT